MTVLTNAYFLVELRHKVLRAANRYAYILLEALLIANYLLEGKTSIYTFDLLCCLRPSRSARAYPAEPSAPSTQLNPQLPSV
jgi:hypothetical protein